MTHFSSGDAKFTFYVNKSVCVERKSLALSVNFRLLTSVTGTGRFHPCSDLGDHSECPLFVYLFCFIIVYISICSFSFNAYLYQFLVSYFVNFICFNINLFLICSISYFNLIEFSYVFLL